MSVCFPSRSLVRPYGRGCCTPPASGHEAPPVRLHECAAVRCRGPRALRVGKRIARPFLWYRHRAGRRSGARRVAASRCGGFTLLETMVALVIFGAAAMALYGVFNTNLIALARAHDVSRQAPAVRHAIEYLSSINPREEGAGRIELGGIEVAWKSRLLEPARQSQSPSGRRGYFEIGLYEVEFALSDQEHPLGTWRMRVAGYEKVREPAQ